MRGVIAVFLLFLTLVAIENIESMCLNQTNPFLASYCHKHSNFTVTTYDKKCCMLSINNYWMNGSITQHRECVYGDNSNETRKTEEFSSYKNNYGIYAQTLFGIDFPNIEDAVLDCSRRYTQSVGIAYLVVLFLIYSVL